MAENFQVQLYCILVYFE